MTDDELAPSSAERRGAFSIWVVIAFGGVGAALVPAIDADAAGDDIEAMVGWCYSVVDG